MILLALALLSPQADPAAVVREQAPLLAAEATRPRALDRLSHAGRAALPLLEAAGADADALRIVREAVALHGELRDSYAAPRLFTFDGKEESLGTLLSRFENASGMTFHKHAVELATPQSLAVKDATFWEALDALAKKVPFTYQAYMGEQLYLNAGMPGEKPVCYHGPFRIALDRVLLQRRLDFERPRQDMTARLHLLWENHVSPIGLTRKFRLARAEDDTGASLLLPPPEETADVPRPVGQVRFPYETLDVGPLRPLSSGARRIASLEGTLEVEFPTRLEKVVFRKPAEPQTRPLEGVAVEFRGFTTSGPYGFTADFALRFGDEKEAAAYRVGARDVSIVTGAGSPQAAQVVDSRREKGHVTFSVRAPRVGAGREVSEIVLRVPRGGRVMNVPFRYRDVELR